MTADISDIIYATAKDVVDIYPVVADVEEFKKLPLPYAVYRIEERFARTKERKRRMWDVSFLIVAQSYADGKALISRLGEKMEHIEDNLFVKQGESKIDFDGDDRVYVCNLNVEIEEL